MYDLVVGLIVDLMYGYVQLDPIGYDYPNQTNSYFMITKISIFKKSKN